VARRSQLRASDQDREHVAERLREAAVEGRLTSDELDERLGRAFAARTYGELDDLIGDLPARRPPAARASVAVGVRRRGLITRQRIAMVALLWFVVLPVLRDIVGSIGDIGHGAGAGPVHLLALAALAPLFFGVAFLCLVLVLVAAVGWALSRAWRHPS
jgi:hypothetical protein